MTSSRVEENNNNSLELDILIDEFQFVEAEIPPPPQNLVLPPKARPLSKLFVSAEEIDHKTHSTYKTKKIKKRIEKTIILSPELYFLKKNSDKNKPNVNEPDPIINALEKYCSSICKHLFPDGVPSTTTIYDEFQNYKLVAVLSKAIKNFKSNREDHLKESDTIVEVTTKEIEHQRQVLDNHIASLLSCSTREKGPISHFFNQNQRQLTATQLCENLVAFQKNEYRFSQQSLAQLQLKLLERIAVINKNIQNNNNKKSYENELQWLEKASKTAQQLRELNVEKITEETSIEALEELDRRTLAKKIDLSDEKKLLTVGNMHGKKIVITAKNLLHYRINKNLAIALTTRYLFKEDDNHSNNMSKLGPIIDFDMTKWNILYKYKKLGPFESLSRKKPDENTYIITERDVREFPNIVDAKPHYWPTSQIEYTESLMKASKLFRIDFTILAKNFFTPDDNAAYRGLATNRFFEFHKFKTMLKYLLTDKQTYRCFAELEIPEKTLSKDENGNYTNQFLIDELVNDEVDRTKELRRVLIKMTEFSTFLRSHGDAAFEILKNEAETEKNKYLSKVATKPYYQKLADSIDIKKMQNCYKGIFIEANAGISYDQNPKSFRFK